MKIFLFFLVVAVIAVVAIWQRQRLGNFFKAIVLSEWNNKVLAILWIASLLLFINAIYQGGGEPLGLQALKKVGVRQSVRETATQKHYRELGKGLLNYPASVVAPADTIQPQDTWFWWQLWFVVQCLVVCFFPIAIWDEVTDGYYKALERFEQRRVRINLRPPKPKEDKTQTPPSPPGPTPAPTPEPVKRSRMQEFWSKVKAGFVGDMAWSMVEHTGPKIIEKFFLRRRR